MNNLFSSFLIYVAISYSFEQNQNYCNQDTFCDECQICGSDTNNYCSCNFENSRCINNSNNQLIFLADFIDKYDGCMSNTNTKNICGESNININIGDNKTIYLQSYSGPEEVICYYNIKKIINNNNDILITLRNSGIERVYFNAYFIIYYNNEKMRISSFNNPLFYDNNKQMNEEKVEKISLYIEIMDGNNINDLSISFSIENKPIIKITYETNSDSKNRNLILGIILGTVGLLIIIIVISIIYKFYWKTPIPTEINLSNNSQKLQKSSLINKNKNEINHLLEKELIPTKYIKKNMINDCYKCTICLEEFKENKSIIITTKCGHSFHLICFKKWVFKNIIFPKCPNCNHPILENQNNSQINYANLSSDQSNTNTIAYNPQITENNNTFTVTKN